MDKKWSALGVFKPHQPSKSCILQGRVTKLRECELINGILINNHQVYYILNSKITEKFIFVHLYLNELTKEIERFCTFFQNFYLRRTFDIPVNEPHHDGSLHYKQKNRIFL